MERQNERAVGEEKRLETKTKGIGIESIYVVRRQSHAN